ncbi:DUF3224 domain-containing protein [Brevundimonas sp. SORGH_AS_0993]|uniref:DUF3224 domain-containing protein n=1 Tax=Brevundimonas sp. SORGH_AS_0993 TaxID=3041794 RepID=UPI00278787AD|nr:DUF3224 domain-containing protein [Brevundimonas sp. SORGH_AS_0993]MDQ1153320.1 hypothetical protein [Brevundimonas sp. SORGH_AS_0993]
MVGALVALSLGLTGATAAHPVSPSIRENVVMSHAAGTFQVSITPAPPAFEAAPDLPGRMILAKTFHGGIEGTAAGEMLAVREGQSGAYVAMERVTGAVNGRNGSFVLVHRGVMTAQGQELLITIVPGSGTGNLAGISGVFHLTIDKGEHRYDLEYSLPDFAT